MGLIPARAGKTWVTASVSPSGKAHPRSRGENIAFTPSHACDQGSSPLARGKQSRFACSWLEMRLIPARAGKTNGVRRMSSLVAAHPRSRGENQPGQVCARHGSGSSPLARGKHFVICAFVTRIGQILETLEPSFSSGIYSLRGVCATDAPLDQVRSIVRVLPSSRDAS